MLHIEFANRFETLSDLFVARIGASVGSAFNVDQVIVPSAAVQRRLTLDLAQRHGICASVAFAYLARWLWQQIGRTVAGVQDESPFDPAVLAWRIHEALDDAAWTAPHARLAAYLGKADALMRYEMAQRVAELFDQYITYRPDWLAAWSRGELVKLGSSDANAHADAQADQAWQAALWRRLGESMDTADRHPVEAFRQALAQPTNAGDVGNAGSANRAPNALPPAIHVFALPAMPPLHLELLQALGRRIEVHLYALNPCREYWFEVVDRRRLGYLAARGQAGHHEEGQRLLAAWGRQTQSQLSLLVDAAGDGAVDDARFVEPAGDSLLARLQASILALVDLAPGSVPLGANDRSIEVHVCHSLTREIEVLQDRLLALFAQPGAAALDEVLVVTPDLAAAAPLIDAVFGTAPPDRFLPYTITGRARSQVNAVARALLDLLALSASRFAASAVFALLQQPLVARRFGLDDDALEQVRGWLQDAGVHWALDGEQRAGLGLPADDRHSLADGLDRLFLGYALPSPAHAAQTLPFGGLLPAGDAEGSSALALGALGAFVDALAALRQRMAAPQPAPAWPALLAGALTDFVAAGDAELEDLREVQAVIEALAAQWRHSDLRLALPLDVVRSALAALLDDTARGGVPTGALTFASLSSLRNLPFGTVCIIGLNDGAFPSSTRPAEFDLMALQPRLGDRQRRSDERNLFLDLLLAARERVHLSYVGRSVRDNAVQPPSVLVAELLEYLIPAIAMPSADGADDGGDASARARARLVVSHPLQPFSQAAFRVDGDIRRRSFQREYAEALRRNLLAAPPRLAALATAADNADNASQSGRSDRSDEGDAEPSLDGDDDANEPAAAFIAAPLPEPGDEWHDVPLERLIEFFRNPCRFLLTQRLGIELRRDDEALQDDEPFVADTPARNALARRLLPALLAGTGADELHAMALAGTELPGGAIGRRFVDQQLSQLQDFAARIAQATAAPCLPPHQASVTMALDGQQWRLHTGFADLRQGGLVRYGPGDIRVGDRLNAWLHHLMLCADAPDGVSPTTTWLGRDGDLQFTRCDDARAVLGALLGLYRRGLTEPLPFFPRTAWARVDKPNSLSAAAGVWRPSKQSPFAEGADAAYRLALRGRPDPLSGAALIELDACAHAVFDPMRACLT